MSRERLTEEQLDFVREMMSIGAGNAAAAFSRMLDLKVEVTIPGVLMVPPTEALSTFEDPSLPVVGIKMRMVGDVTGDLFLVLPKDKMPQLVSLMRKAMPEAQERGRDAELSILAEIGSIIAGVYLTAIHDFCKLNIYHSVASVGVDMIGSLIDESVAAQAEVNREIILIENEFVVGETLTTSFFLMIPPVKSLATLARAIEQARAAYRAA